MKNQISSILRSRNYKLESVDDLTDFEQKSLAIESITDLDNFDPADILLYRNKILNTILSKFLNQTMTADQCMSRILDMLVKGTRSSINELIDEARSDRDVRLESAD